jgi:hypothetical protein
MSSISPQAIARQFVLAVRRLLIQRLACVAFFLPVAGFAQSLASYYVFFVDNRAPPSVAGTRTTIPPQMRTVGGAPEPELMVYFSNEYQFDTMRYYYLYQGTADEIWAFEPSYSLCLALSSDYLKIRPAALVAGAQTAVKYQFAYATRYGGDCGRGSFNGDPRVVFREAQDLITFGAPIRRKAIDGGAFDASPMTVAREGVPWMTYYWGYRLGMVESRSDWDDKNKGLPQFAGYGTFPTPTQNFALTTLPPPFVEGEVTEYVNVKDFPKQPGGQYFYAARQADRDALDAAPNWQRTQRSFNAGGYVNVCRFYGGGKPGGPNTHFFTADDTECARLKTLPFLDFEGTPFVADLPIPAANASQAANCRTGTRPLYRAYNNAYGPKGQNDWQSNHRFVTNKADIAAMVAVGWADEGVAMCVPVLP